MYNYSKWATFLSHLPNFEVKISVKWNVCGLLRHLVFIRTTVALVEGEWQSEAGLCLTRVVIWVIPSPQFIFLILNWLKFNIIKMIQFFFLILQNYIYRDIMS